MKAIDLINLQSLADLLCEKIGALQTGNMLNEPVATVEALLDVKNKAGLIERMVARIASDLLAETLESGGVSK